MPSSRSWQLDQDPRAVRATGPGGGLPWLTWQVTIDGRAAPAVAKCDDDAADF